MKRNILKALAVASVLCFSTTVFAATPISGPTTFGGGTFAPSAKVKIMVDSPDGKSYAVSSQHENGKKQFASNNSSPKIYFKDAVSTGPDTVTITTNLDTDWKTY